MKTAALFLFFALPFAAISCKSIPHELVGSYRTGVYMSYEPRKVDIRADGRVLVAQMFDAPIELGNGRRSHVLRGVGRWRVISSDFIEATVSTTRESRKVYFITLLRATPRGKGIFVSERRSADPVWATNDDFLEYLGPVEGDRSVQADREIEHLENGRFPEKGPNQSLQRNAGSRPSSDDSSASEAPSSLGPRG